MLPGRNTEIYVTFWFRGENSKLKMQVLNDIYFKSKSQVYLQSLFWQNTANFNFFACSFVSKRHWKEGNTTLHPSACSVLHFFDSLISNVWFSSLTHFQALHELNQVHTADNFNLFFISDLFSGSVSIWCSYIGYCGNDVSVCTVHSIVFMQLSLYLKKKKKIFC